ncbi:MAG: metal-dependent hydrolase [Rhodobacteraceae bacterium]|nr:MAG: metal-dependent hydrolase [Paracoccaceae bacterium]
MNGHHILIYGDERIPYRVHGDPKRTTRIAIHVDPDGSVIVDAPLNQPDEAIRKSVQKRARWIVDHVTEARDRYRHVQPKTYVSGEQVLYLGRRYMLKVIQSDFEPAGARLRGGRLVVVTKSPKPHQVRAIVRAWYRTRARDYFAKQIDEQSMRLPWVEKSPPFRLLEMKRQWGSCSTNGQIILNPHLIKAPRDCTKYVIVHELTHLKHHDHSAGFFREVDRYAPGWQKPKKMLDEMVEVLGNE